MKERIIDEDTNIVLIVADTLSAFHLPIYGYDRDTAPFLTKMAEENTYAKFAYSNSPWTIPSHASLFSGKLPNEHKSTNKHGLKFKEDSFVEELSDKGYTTIGVSCNSLISSELDFDKGFDYMISGFENIWFKYKGAETLREISSKPETEFNSKKEKYTAFLKQSIRNKDIKSLKEGLRYLKVSKQKGAPRMLLPEGGGAEAVNQVALEKLSELEEDENFFLFLNYLEPHLPLMPPKEIAKEWVENPDKAAIELHEKSNELGQRLWTADLPDQLLEKWRCLYDAQIRHMDSKIQELYNKIEQDHENTVFIFISDHGENIGDYGMQGHTHGIWEKLIRIPLVVFGENIESRDLDQNISVNKLENFIVKEKSLSTINSKKLFSIRFSTNSSRKRNSDDLKNDKYHQNESKGVVIGDEGMIKNSKIQNTYFKAKENDMSDNCDVNRAKLSKEIDKKFEQIIGNIEV